MTPTLNQRSGGVSPGQGGRVDMAAAVAEFHRAFNLPMRQLPSAEIDDALARLRVALLEEEVSEFVAASEKADLIGIADALADIVYVAYGTALTYGIDLDSALREVHRSNMSKLGSDGTPLIRGDGKVLKSERYFPPDIAAVLSRQSPLSLEPGR
jgi:predicted HAD superfamily Cof-like phosphohydrolase